MRILFIILDRILAFAFKSSKEVARKTFSFPYTYTRVCCSNLEPIFKNSEGVQRKVALWNCSGWHNST